MPRRSPADSDRQDRLSPSRFSGPGFLGEDPRDWDEVVAADEKALAELGLDSAQVAAALRTTYEAAVQALGDSVQVAPNVSAFCLECRGRTPSPFAGEGTFPKHQVFVSDKSDGRLFTLTALGLHLIERHHFFQGHGSPFRVDPVLAARKLGLAALGC